MAKSLVRTARIPSFPIYIKKFLFKIPKIPTPIFASYIMLQSFAPSPILRVIIFLLLTILTIYAFYIGVALQIILLSHYKIKNAKISSIF